MKHSVLDYCIEWAGNPSLGHFLFRALQKQWPQLNEATTIRPTQDKEFEVLLADEWAVMHPQKIQVTLKTRGLKGTLYRAAGELLNKPQVIAKGYYREWQTNPAVAPAATRTVRIMHWGVDIRGEQFRLLAAYEPMVDCLYIYDRHRSNVPSVMGYKP